ncbi:hypothetical putative RHH DNA-binding protein [Aeropyrum globular virus 1]|uniref:CopG-like transcriptional repressor n=1 Tax=Aeropyrum globular virus 1 TaxID=1932713 RepID=UPI000C7F402A|nr:CopG-like transcriptional repressor [Aeropyrum globular virus 1]BBC20947.1 hypothetical putative RHH DNA-binding protein [Aeropyrum globular virus 1]
MAAMDIEVILTPPRGRGMLIFSFKAPPQLIQEFDKAARAAGVTRSTAIRLLIRHALENPELLKKLAERGE